MSNRKSQILIVRRDLRDTGRPVHSEVESVAQNKVPRFAPDHPMAYWEFRDHVADEVRCKRIPATIDGIAQGAAEYGAGISDSAEWAERFVGQVSRDLARRSRRQAG